MLELILFLMLGLFWSDNVLLPLVENVTGPMKAFLEENLGIWGQKALFHFIRSQLECADLV